MKHYCRQGQGLVLINALACVVLLCVLPTLAKEQNVSRQETTQTEVGALCKDIQMLVSNTIPDSAYSYSLILKPNRGKVFATLKSFFNGKPQRTQRFTLPGKYTFKVTKGAAGGHLVELHAREYWNLGLYDESTANALCDKLIKLNTILGRKK